jgi:hypothetical protein
MTQALYAHMNNKTILKKENLQKKKKERLYQKDILKLISKYRGFKLQNQHKK